MFQITNFEYLSTYRFIPSPKHYMFALFPLLVGTVVVASSLHSRIPFHIKPGSGMLVINATISDSTDYFPMTLIPSSEIWYPFSSVAVPLLVVQTVDPSDRIVLGGSVIAPYFNAAPAVLGIGARSDIVTHFESVSIQRLSIDSGIVVIGDPDDDEDGFLESCIPETLLRIRLGSLGDSFRARLNSGEISDFILSAGSGGILTVPPSDFDLISNTLRAHGAISVNGTIFENCAFSNLAELPEFSIEFENGASIVISPEDYLNRQNQTCLLKVSRASDQDFSFSTFYFDPLRIPHMNVRFSARFMELCDSLA